mgnify:FL=1
MIGLVKLASRDEEFWVNAIVLLHGRILIEFAQNAGGREEMADCRIQQYEVRAGASPCLTTRCLDRTGQERNLWPLIQSAEWKLMKRPI